MREMSERRLRWGALVPGRWSWVHVLATPTSYLLLLSAVATMAAKLPVVRGLHGIGFWPARWLGACAKDIAFFLGLAALLALGEHVRRRMLFATLPLALIVTAVAIINASYLTIAGEQLTWPVLMLGLMRFGDVQGIVGATVIVGPLGTLLIAAVAVAPPAIAILALRRAAKPIGPWVDGQGRARALGLCALVGLVLLLVVPSPRQYALERLHANAVLRTYWGMTTGTYRWKGPPGTFNGYLPRDLVDADALATLRTGPRRNVVLIVLESTRRDDTSLAGPTAPARTPNLVALAARGLDLTHARTVIPQTTKSVWSMLCGRLPLLETTVFENTGTLDVQCVPSILDTAGWRTGFFQSAIGRFEDRPRLVGGLGFREFLSSEHITSEILGYLASDDEILVKPLAAWIDQAPDQPFFATLLTSATHHPYDLSTSHAARLKIAGAPHESERERYDRQIEAADRMIGDVLGVLHQRGLTDRTIVIVVGDHGEGFGDKGIKQHGSNFFEEGLRVPFVIAGPGVPPRKVDAATTLLDLAPTLLEMLGVPMSAAASRATHARSILREAPRDRVLPFACFYDNACRGFVRNDTKVVYVPETGQAFSYDLAADPDESKPTPLSDELAARLAEVQTLIDAHRSAGWPRTKTALDRFPKWTCAPDVVCKARDPFLR